MLKSFFSGLYHQFMAGRLAAEMPAADADVISSIVAKNAESQPKPQQRPLRNPFRLGERTSDWRLEIPRIGVL